MHWKNKHVKCRACVRAENSTMLKRSWLLPHACCVGVQWATRREWSTWGSWWVSYSLALAPYRATRRTSATKWPPVSQFLLFTTCRSYCSPKAAGVVQGGQAQQSDPQWVSFCCSQHAVVTVVPTRQALFREDKRNKVTPSESVSVIYNMQELL